MLKIFCFVILFTKWLYYLEGHITFTEKTYELSKSTINHNVKYHNHYLKVSLFYKRLSNVKSEKENIQKVLSNMASLPIMYALYKLAVKIAFSFAPKRSHLPMTVKEALYTTIDSRQPHPADVFNFYLKINGGFPCRRFQVQERI